MPKTRNALLRYRILDHCFSNRFRKYTIDDLLAEVNAKLMDLSGTGVILRQLKDDIRILRDPDGYNAPVEAVPFEGKKCCYRYADPSFSIFKSELSVEDLNNLCSTVDMLKRYRGNPANVWLDEIIAKLEFRLGIKADRENVVDFDRNDRLRGLEHLSALIEATVNHRPLEVTYRNYKGREQTDVLHPYYVKQYNTRWFLFGHNATYGRISNFALDRIVTFRHKDVPFVRNTTTDFNRCFDDIIGVTIPHSVTPPQRIVLRFSPDRFPYVVTKPLHSSQVVTDAAACEVAVTVRPNRELRQQVFSFLPDVEVLSPAWFREEVRQTLLENLRKYGPVQEDCTDKP